MQPRPHLRSRCQPNHHQNRVMSERSLPGTEFVAGPRSEVVGRPTGASRGGQVRRQHVQGRADRGAEPPDDPGRRRLQRAEPSRCPSCPTPGEGSAAAPQTATAPYQSPRRADGIWRCRETSRNAETSSNRETRGRGFVGLCQSVTWKRSSRRRCAAPRGTPPSGITGRCGTRSCLRVMGETFSAMNSGSLRSTVPRR